MQNVGRNRELMNPMLSVGDTVSVEVTSPQVYGVFCRNASAEMLVVIPETSWIASFNSCLQFVRPGDQLTVKIKNIDIPTGKISASVKSVHPNPWETKKIIVGGNYDARVVRFVESADRCCNKPAYLIELLPGAYVMLSAGDHQVASGQVVAVKILAADLRQASVVVDWARPSGEQMKD
jgi:predicted RNA-binding protein with RPS1 domain